MPWLKVSDQSAFHPVVLRALNLPEADDRTLNELFGFITRCAVSAAAYETDYLVSLGVVKQVAGMSRWKELADAAVRAGYFVAMQDEQGTFFYKLVEEKDLFHMILRDERAWANQQKRDVSNTKLTVPVRKRDGDQCRWCGKIVNWKGDRRSGRSGTYEHLHPGQAATTDTLVIACGACNFARRDDAVGWTGRLRPAPQTPYYSNETAQFLAKHGVTVQPSGALPLDVPDTKTVSLTPVEPPRPVEPNPRHGCTGPGWEQSPGVDPVEPPRPVEPNPRHGCTDPGRVQSPRDTDTVTPDRGRPPRPPEEQEPRQARPSEPNPHSGRTGPEPPSVEPAPPRPGRNLTETKPPWQKTTLRNLDSSGRGGTGRDGQGQDGTGQAGKPLAPSPSEPALRAEPPAPRTRRSRRRRRR